jgi:hypothetical protein
MRVGVSPLTVKHFFEISLLGRHTWTKPQGTSGETQPSSQMSGGKLSWLVRSATDSSPVPTSLLGGQILTAGAFRLPLSGESSRRPPHCLRISVSDTQ